jgi:hypothetical protein
VPARHPARPRGCRDPSCRAAYPGPRKPNRHRRRRFPAVDGDPAEPATPSRTRLRPPPVNPPAPARNSSAQHLPAQTGSPGNRRASVRNSSARRLPARTRSLGNRAAAVRNSSAQHRSLGNPPAAVRNSCARSSRVRLPWPGSPSALVNSRGRRGVGAPGRRPSRQAYRCAAARACRDRRPSPPYVSTHAVAAPGSPGPPLARGSAAVRRDSEPAPRRRHLP